MNMRGSREIKGHMELRAKDRRDSGSREDIFLFLADKGSDHIV